MFNFKNKIGFTLAETLICLAIIGIVAVSTITAAKPMTEKATRIAYTNAYEGLSTAFYNSMIKITNTDNHPFKGDEENGKVLCERLTEQIANVVLDCNAKVIDDKGNKFENNQIRFISANGYRFYISKKMKTKEYRFGDDEKYVTEFYLVYVDINGDKKPNRLEYDEKSLSDIFAFALLDTGMTVPLGLPEYDMHYMQAKMAYNNKYSEIVLAEPPLPYYMAKNAAWGCYDKVHNEEEKALQDVFNNPEVPFTMNEIIRDSLSESSKIRIKLPDATNELVYKEKTPQCTRFDYENCFVEIDRYRW